MPTQKERIEQLYKSYQNNIALSNELPNPQDRGALRLMAGELATLIGAFVVIAHGLDELREAVDRQTEQMKNTNEGQ